MFSRNTLWNPCSQWCYGFWNLLLVLSWITNWAISSVSYFYGLYVFGQVSVLAGEWGRRDLFSGANDVFFRWYWWSTTKTRLHARHQASDTTNHPCDWTSRHIWRINDHFNVVWFTGVHDIARILLLHGSCTYLQLAIDDPLFIVQSFPRQVIKWRMIIHDSNHFHI